MFWHRVDHQLEFAAIMDMMQMPNLSTCSEETQALGWQIESAIYTGIGYSMDLMNMESFLGNVADWLEHRYG